MKTAILFGASGNIGSYLLKLLLASDKYEQVKIVVRQPLNLHNPKLLTIIGDYERLVGVKEQLNADDVFIIISASDKSVEKNYTVLIAQLCKEQSAKTVSVVTSVGANPKSSIFFARLKGEIEEAILNLHYKQTHIFRPGMIMGERAFYRPMEKTMMRLWKIMNPFLIGALNKYKGMHAKDIASAMFLNAGENKEAVNIIHCKAMDRIIKNAEVKAA